MPRSRPLVSTPKGTYLDIAAEMQEDILVGRLSPGTRLPAQRELATERRVTQGTIHRAYAELARRGLISAEVGRGSFVLDVSRSLAPSSLQPGLIDMAANKPATPAHTESLRETMRRLLQRKDLSDLLEYQPAAGEWRHREAVAQWLRSFNITVGAESVALTVGAQLGNAATLLALTSPGEPVLVEEFTYTGMKSLAQTLDRRLVPVRMDEEGLIPDALRDAARGSGARCLYCMPGLHNPTNASMSAGRRRAIATLAEKLDLKVIEDGVYDFMVDPKLIPLVSLIPNRTVYLTSLSKSVASGLRMGVVVAPATVIQAVAAKLQGLIWTAPPLMAELATDWIAQGVVTRLTDMHLQECSHRLSIARHAFSGAEFHAPPRTAHLWIRMPAGWASPDFVVAAKTLGVALAPTSAFSVGDARSESFVRVGLASPATSQLVAVGLNRISELLQRKYSPQLPPISLSNL